MYAPFVLGRTRWRNYFKSNFKSVLLFIYLVRWNCRRFLEIWCLLAAEDILLDEWVEFWWLLGNLSAFQQGWSSCPGERRIGFRVEFGDILVLQQGLVRALARVRNREWWVFEQFFFFYSRGWEGKSGTFVAFLLSFWILIKVSHVCYHRTVP